MELSLIRNLMDKDFYNNNKGTRCPDKLFTKDVQKIKHSIDNAMATYDRSVSPEEVEALFLSANPTLTTAQKSVYKDMFTQLKETNLLDKDIAHDIMSTLFRQVVGEDIAKVIEVNFKRSGLFNPLNKDWGIGQVQSIINNRITVNFENVGKKVINAKNVELKKLGK